MKATTEELVEKLKECVKIADDLLVYGNWAEVHNNCLCELAKIERWIKQKEL